jgi:hypothetical protein
VTRNPLSVVFAKGRPKKDARLPFRHVQNLDMTKKAQRLFFKKPSSRRDKARVNEGA